MAVLLLGVGIYQARKADAPTLAAKAVPLPKPVATKERPALPQAAVPKTVAASRPTNATVPAAKATVVPGHATNKANAAASRNQWVKGLVTDTLGMPIAGASILINGGNRGVAADSSGAFMLKVGSGDWLAVQAIGFETKSVQPNKQQNLSIALAPTSNRLSEVVVLGYGFSAKKQTTGTSITTNPRQLAPNLQVQDASQRLQGRVAGVQVSGRPTGRREGFLRKPEAPGSATEVRIRGNATLQAENEPLYVINGKIASGKILKQLAPSAISKIEVLKDASATALYGSRASHGVVIITTKKLTKKEVAKLRRFNAQLLHSGIKMDPPLPPQATAEEYNPLVENPFTSPQVSPLSTFSIDVDNASYTNIRRYLNAGEKVPADAVRVEEMINFFKYQYALPTGDRPFAAQTELSDAPWNKAHKLLRIALKAKDIPLEELPPSNIVFLLDVSGSMNEPNKLPLLKSSMKVLVDQLRQQDKVSIVVYAGAAGLVLPPTSGQDKATIMDALNKLNAGGSTAGGEGIELAYKSAAENFITGGNNRVVLATDGDFNVGISAQGDLQRLIEEKRRTGIFLTCLGFGMGNYKDGRLETLADKGNGNYAYIDNMQESNRFLGKEFKGTVFAVAKDVKLQIEFNPAQVKAYRLIGYENRKLNDEDFVNDKIDAGEMGIGHTVTAFYEIIPVGVSSTFAPALPNLKYSNKVVATDSGAELATIKFRYKQPDANISTEFVQVVAANSTGLKNASEDFRFAAAVAWFGLTLRKSDLIAAKALADIIQLAKGASSFDPDGYRAECIRLMGAVN
ncbi:MAG: DUF3520 domain-containing protein [Bacteroidetes bacterium]|nr:MAG: DUF3520 domain-containing protein [Bacteroidota bacterium]